MKYVLIFASLVTAAAYVPVIMVSLQLDAAEAARNFIFSVPTITAGLVSIFLELRNKAVTGYYAPVVGSAVFVNWVLYPSLYHTYDFDGFIQTHLVYTSLAVVFFSYFMLYRMGKAEHEVTRIEEVNRYTALALPVMSGVGVCYALFTYVYTCPRVGDMCALGAGIALEASLVVGAVSACVWFMLDRRFRHRTHKKS